MTSDIAQAMYISGMSCIGNDYGAILERSPVYVEIFFITITVIIMVIIIIINYYYN